MPENFNKEINYLKTKYEAYKYFLKCIEADYKNPQRNIWKKVIYEDLDDIYFKAVYLSKKYPDHTNELLKFRNLIIDITDYKY